MEQTIERMPEEIRGLIKEVTLKELFKRRLSRKRSVVIKIQEKLFLVEDPGEKIKQELKTFFDTNLCSQCEICRNGQLCIKVAERSREYTKRIEPDFVDAIKEAKRIEKYPFIIKRIEAFNYPIGDEYFLVSECEDFKRFRDTKPKKQLDVSKTNNSKGRRLGKINF